jgi:hypothetical protein
MAESDMKPLSELDLYNNLMDENSLLPMTVRPSGSNITRKVYFNALKIQIAGYDLVGTLTAGSTSITLSSTGTTYNEQTAYAVGARVIYTDPNDQEAVAKNYICTHACSAGNWNTNGYCFVEYPLLDSNSNIRIFTSVFGVNPTAASIADNAITLTFPAQSSDIGVKVRVY